MEKFRLTQIAPDVWEIQADGLRVGELHCSWSTGYDPHFDNPSDAELAMDFWLWLNAHHQTPQSAFRWL